jgi:hypothetical protein
MVWSILLSLISLILQDLLTPYTLLHIPQWIGPLPLDNWVISLPYPNLLSQIN